MTKPPTVVALIPARSGSKRLVHKNIRLLGGHPALAYTICAARASQIFDAVIVSTDSECYADVARYYGAEVPFLRPSEASGDRSPDIDWVQLTIDRLDAAGRRYDAFSLLRPTSPFRKPDTIVRAWRQFVAAEGVDSLRAVEPVEQHPGKMWVVRAQRMTPLLPLSPEDAPWHSQQMAALPRVHVQNASLEIAWTRVVRDGHTIAGTVLTPFLTEADEGIDINRQRDWFWAEHLLSVGEAKLPDIDRAPYPLERLPAGVI
uniref:Acylneuraminate cytidylyltransferase n=1 Tax=Rhodopseudomonas palustris (strain BisA53) TaxID=316055 RepID=Q07IS0_RHOP5